MSGFVNAGRKTAPAARSLLAVAAVPPARPIPLSTIEQLPVKVLFARWFLVATVLLATPISIPLVVLLWSGVMAGGVCDTFSAMLDMARGLWAAARELDSILGDRDDAALVANKHWVGPHQETFDKDLTTDSVEEQALVGLLETAARDWANAWVAATNEESQKTYDRAVDDADSDWEWVPGISDAPVNDFTPITKVPQEPDFEPEEFGYVNTAGQ